ncbi:hypothetical protein IKG48_00395 [Candidatus Saccharibacteria bacterium]|nr:hypothetical protein [Candidatus Saccharibacteria bacterium]
MGIMVQKNEDNSKLNEQINADLRERAERTSKQMDPDYVEDSDYAKDLKKTGRFAWIWAVLIVLAIISLIIIFV